MRPGDGEKLTVEAIIIQPFSLALGIWAAGLVWVPPH